VSSSNVDKFESTEEAEVETIGSGVNISGELDSLEDLKYLVNRFFCFPLLQFFTCRIQLDNLTYLSLTLRITLVLHMTHKIAAENLPPVGAIRCSIMTLNSLCSLSCLK